MAFQGVSNSGEDPPLSFQMQLLLNKDRMTQARARGDAHQYWVFFDTIMGDLVSFMSAKVRAKLEGRHEELLAKIAKIRADPQMNDTTKTKEILKLRVDFADDNKYYISKSLSRADIVRVKDEGVVNLEKETIDRYAVAIRSDDGLEASAKKLESKDD